MPRNQVNNQPQFKDSALTGSFTMPSKSSVSSKQQSPNNNLLYNNQFIIKSSTPVLNERCLSPVNRLDLATSKEQLEHLEEFCNRDTTNNYLAREKAFQSNYQNVISHNSSSHSNQFNYFNQFHNQSPNSTCSTPNRSAKSSSSTTSRNNSLPKSSGNYLDKLYSNYSFQLRPSMFSKSNDDNLSLSLSSADQNSLAYFKFINDSSNFGSNVSSQSGSNFNSNANSNHQVIRNFLLQPSQTNSFTSLNSSCSNSSNNNRNSIFGRSPFSWFRRASRSSSAPELGESFFSQKLINFFLNSF